MLPILLKTEEACVALATSASVALGLVPESTIYVRHGQDDQDVLAPAIICQAASATEDFPFSGIYHVTTNIKVREMAGDQVGTGSFGAISDPIFHAFLTPVIEDTLTNMATNYFVYKLILSETSNNTSGDAWSQEYQFDIICGLSA